MTLVRRPSPFSELMTLHQAMDRIFADTVFTQSTNSTGHENLARLSLDVPTTADAILVEAALPGIEPADVEITVENDTLTCRAEDRASRTQAGA